jgi:aminopeptidase YwaD
MKKLFFFLFLCATQGYSQDISFAKRMVDTLTSPTFWGRGYTNDGMAKAAGFLADQFKTYGVQPVNGNSY